MRNSQASAASGLMRRREGLHPGHYASVDNYPRKEQRCFGQSRE